MDVISQFKENQAKGWASFITFETITGVVAPRLVRFAGIGPGMRVLDVGCGTGVLALTAARAGARASGLDLTPELVAHARENAALAGLEVELRQGDVEALPYADGTFDAVTSQFGHMFAPRPEAAIAEMLRVLRPGGTIAFSTWPPESIVGKMFTLTASYAPPLPPGVSPPVQWGDTKIVRERLGERVRDLHFERDLMRVPALSPRHFQVQLEHIGPMGRLVAMLAGEPERLASFRRELAACAEPHFYDNTVLQDFLLTRARKA